MSKIREGNIQHTLTREQLELLEDCIDDEQGLWEAGWTSASKPVGQRVALISSLVERGLLELLSINEWEETRSAVSLPCADALLLVGKPENYVAPCDGHLGKFNVLSITAKGRRAQAAYYN